MSHGSVIVIGAGVIGTACALKLQEQGFSVTLLDHDQPGQATSFGNASVIAASEVVPIPSPGLIMNIPKLLLDPERPLFISPAYMMRVMSWMLKFLRNTTKARTERNAAALASLCNLAMAETRQWLEGLNLGQDTASNPSLRLYQTRAAIKKDAYKLDLRRRHGVEMEFVNGAEIRRLEPAIQNNYEAGVLTEGTHNLRVPVRPITRSADKLRAMGGNVVLAEVSHLLPGENSPSVVLKSGDILNADRVMLAAGIWSGLLARRLGERFPLESERGYHVQYTRLDIGLSRGLSDTARGMAFSQMDGGLRVAGTVEFRGVDVPPDPRRIEVLKRHAKTVFGDVLDGYETTTWMGHRPSLPDGLPVIGPSARQIGLFHAFGHGHLGLTLAATTANIVADVMLSHAPSVDIRPFAAGRF